MPRHLLRGILFVLAVALVLAGCASSSGEDPAETAPVRTTLVVGARDEPEVPLPKGDPPEDLVVEDLREGKGIEAQRGDLLATKLVAKFVTGRSFESSWGKKGESFIFELGSREANPGWEKGIPGMKVGGLRKLIVPPDEGSQAGEVGDGKPKDTLVYVVELIAILPPEIEGRQEPTIVPPEKAPPSELEVKDLIKGTGPAAKKGDILTIEYVGLHYDGERFTNSWKRKRQFDFKLGAKEIEVNPGWEVGLPGMRVGGRRELIIPPNLHYEGVPTKGEKSYDTLIYVVDLVGITEPKAQPDLQANSR